MMCQIAGVVWCGVVWCGVVWCGVVGFNLSQGQHLLEADVLHKDNVFEGDVPHVKRLNLSRGQHNAWGHVEPHVAELWLLVGRQ